MSVPAAARRLNVEENSSPTSESISIDMDMEEELEVLKRPRVGVKFFVWTVMPDEVDWGEVSAEELAAELVFEVSTEEAVPEEAE